VKDELAIANDAARYRALGLLANPFPLSADTGEPDAIDTEVGACANELLGVLDVEAGRDKAKPIWVSKSADIPSFYPLRAISMVERSLIEDDSVGVLHAYVQLFMMRSGRVRATLNTVAERLAFRAFDKTLALYVAKVLAEPDEELISYLLLGADGLSSFAAEFEKDSAAAIEMIFGKPELERRPELDEMGDVRLVGLDSDVAEDDTSPELDASVGDAPGTAMIQAEEAEARDQWEQKVLDYLVEYTKVHLSPVIARALRVYRERGISALSAELKVTKAPRKTLAALARLARVRFRKVVLIYDGFGGWAQVPSETRSAVMSALLELRWLLESDGLIIMLLERDEVPELEEQFASATRIDWDFEGVVRLEESPGVLDRQLMDRALAAAAVSGAEPLTLEDPVLDALMTAAGGSMQDALVMARAAIEDAARRGVARLDDESRDAGLAARSTEPVEP
jgi:hypothetical protein